MLARHHTGPVGPVTPVELFFDVVFVFTITQLTRVFEKDLTLAGAGRTLEVSGQVSALIDHLSLSVG